MRLLTDSCHAQHGHFSVRTEHHAASTRRLFPLSVGGWDRRGGMGFSSRLGCALPCLYIVRHRRREKSILIRFALCPL
jgi:hypothetical protein